MKYKNILQIDDDIEDCEFFEQTLKMVSTASYTSIQNPRLALHKLISREITPDLIFLDVNMPSMSGPELLLELRKSEHLKNIPVIILSTSPLFSHLKCIVSDTEQYLIKPNTFNELKSLILKSIT